MKVKRISKLEGTATLLLLYRVSHPIIDMDWVDFDFINPTPYLVA